MLFLAIVSGCSSRVTEDRICPTVAFVDGLERMTLFRDASSGETSNILFISKFSDLINNLSSKLTLQEKLTQEIAEEILENLSIGSISIEQALNILAGD